MFCLRIWIPTKRDSEADSPGSTRYNCDRLLCALHIIHPYCDEAADVLKQVACQLLLFCCLLLVPGHQAFMHRTQGSKSGYEFSHLRLSARTEFELSNYLYLDVGRRATRTDHLRRVPIARHSVLSTRSGKVN